MLLARADRVPLEFAELARTLCAFAGVSVDGLAELMYQNTRLIIDKGEIGDWVSGKHLPQPRNKQLIWEALATRLRLRPDFDALRKQFDEVYARAAYSRSRRPAVAKVRTDRSLAEVTGAVTPGLPTSAGPTDRPRSEVRDALRIALPFGPEVSIWPGAAHPEHPGVAHPDNREALGELWALFDRVDLREHAFTERPTARRHFWALGSSTSTAEVSQVFGTVVEGAYSGWETPPPVALKWVFGRTSRHGRRYIEGKEVLRALTGLFEARTATLILDPVLDGEWLCTDYVLITRMPNVFTLGAFRDGLSFLSIAGLTGVGTKAIALALRQDHVARELASLAGPSGAYQALLQVGGVSHDGAKATSKAMEAGEIRFLEGETIDVDEERIRAWIAARSTA